MSEQILISATQLYRYYGPHAAVSDLTLHLNKGEVLGLLGPNGAGKSSTLQMLSGNLAPSAGQISIQGIDLLSAPKRAKRELGYLPEQPPVYRDLSVDEYLHYCARLHGLASKQIKTAVQNAKARCGLSDVGRRMIGNLSKGYQQRVGIAQAIVHAPAVVILDEPTVGLDPIQILQIRDLIRELGREHSVILSTHILPEVQAVCDRVQIINNGRTVFNESLANLQGLAKPVIIAAFEHTPDTEKLAALAGIEHIEQLSDGRWRLTHANNNSPAAELAELAAQAGWRLTELSPERTTLEQIFIEHIHHENAKERLA